MLQEELLLPCGVRLKNRIAKSAMSENMAVDHKPDLKFQRLYKLWAEGGTGLLITGNVMIDSTALGEAYNVVLDSQNKIDDELKLWAQSGTYNDTALWMQLNHPGKQSPKFLSPTPVAPSALEFASPLNKLFNKPRELSEEEINKIIKAFGYAAKKAKDCGFSGVQIHGAHGYLVSQFLSPRHNQRNDQWGGSLENRMRFVLSIYKEIRSQVGDKFPVGIKLNSSDFQKNAFTQEESIQVMTSLDKAGIDLIEISGGTYEMAAMMGKGKQKESTQKREAYFLEFAELARKNIKCPLLLTGGFRTRKGMEEALQGGAVDMIGLARSLAIDPQFSNKLIKDDTTVSPVKRLSTGFKTLDRLLPLEIIWYTDQIHRLGKGLTPNPNRSVLAVALNMIFEMGLQSLKKQRA